MSFRQTFITEFLYKNGRNEELLDIKKRLESIARIVYFSGDLKRGYGYFHGVIKDLYPTETKEHIKEIKKIIGKTRIKIVYE